MESYCLPDFWERYNALPKDVKETADKAFDLWRADQSHPSIQFKKLKAQTQPVWEARVGADYRAFCTREGEDYIWFWIGSKAEAKKLY